MVKKNYFTCFIFFCSFTSLVCGEKNILPRSRSRSEPGVFDPLEPEPLEKKYQEPETEPLEKKSGAGAAKKFAGSPALAYCDAFDRSSNCNLMNFFCNFGQDQISQMAIGGLIGLILFDSPAPPSPAMPVATPQANDIIPQLQVIFLIFQ